MKKLFVIMFGMAIALCGQSALAQAKKQPAAPAVESPKAAEVAKVKPDKPMPMYAMVDSIDAKAMTFTHKNKDGKVVKHVVTAKTEIKNGEKAAKFEDIKVGDFVSGLRLKKSGTEYEVVKITKFGPEMKKAETTPKK